MEETLFSEHLVTCNSLRQAGLEQWAFYPGMLFGATEKWWGDRGRRPRPHEGIDLCLYTDKAGRAFRLHESSRIPVMLDGEIVKIEEDFLGKSVYLDSVPDLPGPRLFLPLQTRPAQFSDGTPRSRENPVLCRGHITTASFRLTRLRNLLSRRCNLPLEGLRVVGYI